MAGGTAVADISAVHIKILEGSLHGSRLAGNELILDIFVSRCFGAGPLAVGAIFVHSDISCAGVGLQGQGKVLLLGGVVDLHLGLICGQGSFFSQDGQGQQTDDQQRCQNEG